MKIHFSTKLISLLFVFVLIICSNNVFAFRAPDGDVAAIDENDKNMNSGPSARGSGEKPVQVDNNVPGLKSCLYRNLNRTFTGNEGLAAVDVLKDILQDYNSQTVERRIHKDNLGFKHIRLTQEYLGIPIVGGEITVHINQKDVIYQVNGKYLPNINISVQPSFNAFDASQIGSTDHIDKTGLRVSREPSLVIYGTNLAYYFIISYDGPEAGEWWYYVDANTGKVLQKYNNIQYAAPGSGANATVQGNRLTGEDGSNVAMTGWKETSGNYFLHNPGNDWQIYDVDAFDWEQLTTSSWGTADRAAVSCGNNYEDTQSWVSSVLLRNSFDNAGAMARANVHEGTNYVNAYWLPSQQQFYFGDGDGTTSNALTVLDVAAHEFGHAVTQFTSNLVYSYESGALNESYSDIMGCAVEFATQTDGRGSYPTHTAGRSDWLLAEDCWVSREALRDMRDPQRFNQPSYYKGTNWYSGSGDNGGVHTNSGVQNFAFYLLSEGGTGSNGGHAYNITGIGIANAAAVAMRANMVYLVSNSQYSDSRSAWVSAATDLGYPVATVGAVWDACGVFGSAGCSGTPEITSPIPNSILECGDVAFNWSDCGTSGATNWWLYVGTTQGGSDIYDSGDLGASTSQTVSGMPEDGSTVYVRLRYLVGNDWLYVDSQYTAASNCGGGGTPEITSPAPNSILHCGDVTFDWSANGASVNTWWLYVGTTLGGRDIHDSGDLGTSTSQIVSGMPEDGSTVYARLWYLVGNDWQYVDSQYTAASNCGGSGTPEITSPAPNSILHCGDVTFNWSPNGASVNTWWVYVGTTLGGSDIHNSGDLGSSTSQAVSGMPEDGSTVYVRLWYLVDNYWQYVDSQYTAASNCGG
ncbi:MAG: peptidase M4 family protein [Planctomycetes bacterium]|nr:peptidase M4 family protein [Planctomycetota bacterium]